MIYPQMIVDSCMLHMSSKVVYVLLHLWKSLAQSRGVKVVYIWPLIEVIWNAYFYCGISVVSVSNMWIFTMLCWHVLQRVFFVHCISFLNEPFKGQNFFWFLCKIQCLPHGKYITSIKKLFLLMTFLEAIETLWVKYLVGNFKPWGMCDWRGQFMLT